MINFQSGTSRRIKLQGGQLSFKDPQDLMSYIKAAQKDPVNGMHLLTQALQWVAQGFIQMVQDSASPDSEDSPEELAAMLTYLAKGWDSGTLDFSETATSPAQAQTVSPAATVTQGRRSTPLRFTARYGAAPKKSASYLDIKKALLRAGQKL